MEKTVIPIKKLVERWSCTESYIYKLEGQKVRGLIRENKFLKESVTNLSKVVCGEQEYEKK